MVLEKLKAAREHAGLTLQDMGKELSMSKVGYWKIESGKTRLSYSYAVQLANKLNTTTDALFLPSELTNTKQKVAQ
jgi:transcriptional regulator with XRE-family HTH domain